MTDLAGRPEGRTPDQLAAHDLLVELRTRIAVQRLPYQYGVEARALESLWEIFGFARKAMKDHPGCEAFSRAATDMLNVQLRPVTAKWHKAKELGILQSRDGADAFRADLERLRHKLGSFALELQDMAYGRRQPDSATPPAIEPAEVDACFAPVAFGIPEGAFPEAAAIAASEASEIARRRVAFDIGAAAGMDAAGLALSGGGIRSATFCLGVVQVLAAKGLARQFDYLSTVSGGGYTGAFLTSRIGSGTCYEEIGSPYGPDPGPVRHVRQNAKYLSGANMRERWLLVAGTLAGMLLNWTAPISVIAAAALLAAWTDTGASEALGLTGGGLGFLSLALLPGYGVALRCNRHRAWLKALALTVALGLLVAACLVLETEYKRFLLTFGAPWPAAGLAAALLALPALPFFLPFPGTPRVKAATIKVLVLAAGAAVPLLALVCFYALRAVAGWPADPGAHAMDPLRYASGAWLVAAVAVGPGLFALLALDINATGPHKAYRDALARTFTQARPGEPDILLAEANPADAAPYHLINATVNLPSSPSTVLRDRRGDFFLLSKCWTGSVSTGYFETAKWSVGGAGLDLATAMAVSGAAASPRMGLSSRPTLSAMLSLLNVRLGLWVRRPGAKTALAPGFMCLFREMSGLGMAEVGPWLNLSDGGHIENMGVYELLRRRCKFIVCVDGEADPDFTFHGQLTLVRHAQIDFGIRMEPRFDDIRLDSRSGFSRSHLQMMRVIYPSEGAGRPEGIGLMLYLKLSLTGNEAELLQRYRKLHPEFPHQPTADQFYDEEQFEAYRQLGVHVAEGAFSDALMDGGPQPADIASWFRRLAGNMLEPRTA